MIGFLSLFLVLAIANADDTGTALPKASKVSDERGGGGAEDLLHMIKKPSALEDNSKPVQISMSCTDGNGNVHRDGEKGFASCLQEKQNK